MASARAGNYIGNSAPYGFIKNPNENGKGSKLKVVEKEAKIVRRIYEWFVYEDLSYSEIARKLNSMRIEKGKGRMKKETTFTDWYEDTVKQVLIHSANV
jgi:hypothetical protein